jgi:hypothetical protein
MNNCEWRVSVVKFQKQRMKINFAFLLVPFFILFISCGNSGGDEHSDSALTDYVATKPDTSYSENGDVLNQIDANGKRQGHWMILGQMNPEKKDFAPNDIIETGFYKDGKKRGVWLYYSPGNKVAGDSVFPE